MISWMLRYRDNKMWSSDECSVPYYPFYPVLLNFTHHSENSLVNLHLIETYYSVYSGLLIPGLPAPEELKMALSFYQAELQRNRSQEMKVEAAEAER